MVTSGCRHALFVSWLIWRRDTAHLKDGTKKRNARAINRNIVNQFVKSILIMSKKYFVTCAKIVISRLNQVDQLRIWTQNWRVFIFLSDKFFFFGLQRKYIWAGLSREVSFNYSISYFYVWHLGFFYRGSKCSISSISRTFWAGIRYDFRLRNPIILIVCIRESWKVLGLTRFPRSDNTLEFC